MSLFQDFQGMRLRGLLYRLLVGDPMRAVFLYRLSSWLHNKGLRPLASVVRYWNVSLHGCDIAPSARIGPGFRLFHSVGVVVGAIEAGKDLAIYQNVTFGGRGTQEGELISGLPTLGDNVSVYAGAVLLGPIRIGNNVKVAANSVLLADVPPDVTVAGIPAKVVRRREAKPEQAPRAGE